MSSSTPARAATVNPCRLCAPLGASLALRGVRGGIPILHGAQGCATYIRRYLISHFREPVDIASSSFGEGAVVFGGESRLFEALDNVIEKYAPEVVGVATTCLAETIGDDPSLSLPAWHRSRPDSPPVISISTPSYKADHSEGFRKTVRALTEAFAPGGSASYGPVAEVGRETLAILPAMVSPADLRHIRHLAGLFDVPVILAPDYADTMDGEAWGEYKSIPEGGTSASQWRALDRCGEIWELGETSSDEDSAAAFLERSLKGSCRRLPLPIGLEAADTVIRAFSEFSGRPAPPALVSERGRLVDAYADVHKYLYGKRVVISCSVDLAAALVRFVAELGMRPVFAASGSPANKLRNALDAHPPEGGLDDVEIADDSDFLTVEEAVGRHKPDLVLSSSKAYRICRASGVPLVRVDFPIHDRIGGPRLLNLGYSGTARLLDAVTNAVMEQRQADSPVGFSYL